MGYLIQPDRRIAAVVVGRGGGSNGKTALVETAVRVIGRELVTAMSVQDLDQSRFAIGSLLGKLLFYDDDVKAGVRLPDGQLKKLSEAKTVTGERKFGATFTFTVRALPILLCNSPPSLADLSHGMQRRLLVFPFEKEFKGRAVDRHLFTRIWDAELPGVLNRYLAGLERVIKRGWNFHRTADQARAAEAWLVEANPVPAFVDAVCKSDVNASCWMKDLYPAFVTWA